MAYRDLDEGLGLTEMADDLLGDSRLGSNKQHRLVPLDTRGSHDVRIDNIRAWSGSRQLQMGIPG